MAEPLIIHFWQHFVQQKDISPIIQYTKLFTTMRVFCFMLALQYVRANVDALPKGGAVLTNNGAETNMYEGPNRSLRRNKTTAGRRRDAALAKRKRKRERLGNQATGVVDEAGYERPEVARTVPPLTRHHKNNKKNQQQKRASNPDPTNEATIISEKQDATYAPSYYNANGKKSRNSRQYDGDTRSPTYKSTLVPELPKVQSFLKSGKKSSKSSKEYYYYETQSPTRKSPTSNPDSESSQKPVVGETPSPGPTKQFYYPERSGKKGKKGSYSSKGYSSKSFTEYPTAAATDFSTQMPTIAPTLEGTEGMAEKRSKPKQKSSKSQKKHRSGKKEGKKGHYDSSENMESVFPDADDYTYDSNPNENSGATQIITSAPSTTPTFDVTTGADGRAVDVLATESPTALPMLARVTSQPTSAPVAAPQFKVQLDLYGIPWEDSLIFEQAATRWESVISGDVPDMAFSTEMIEGSLCDLPEVVDDIFVCGWYADFEDGVLGWAGPEFVRSDSLLPISGVMEFDQVEIHALGGDLKRVILHELAHVLGLGTVWEAKSLVLPADQGCAYRLDSAASREWQALSGCSDQSIPVETDFGDGTACGHWDEECLQGELMTGFNNGGMEISRLTVGSLEDLGYTVDYSQADEFTWNDLAESCVCNAKLVAPGNLRSSSSSSHNKKKKKPKPKRQLSAKGHKKAVAFGQQHLKEMAKRKKHLGPDKQQPEFTEPLYVADQYVSVLFVENGQAHAVEVWNEDRR